MLNSDSMSAQVVRIELMPLNNDGSVDQFFKESENPRHD